VSIRDRAILEHARAEAAEAERDSLSARVRELEHDLAGLAQVANERNEHMEEFWRRSGKVGKLNHHPSERTINWRDFLRRAEDALDQHRKARYIKRDLEAFREVPA
jgi:hypothetical protein